MIHRNAIESVLLVIVLSMAMTGCFGKNGSGGNDMPAARTPTKFDTVKEPAINAGTRFAAGQLAETQGQTTVAIRQYNEALKMDPAHRESMFRLGVCYAQIKDYENAVTIWGRYIKATNGAVDGYISLAQTYEVAGELTQAEATFGKAIARDPQNKDARLNYALMLARNNRTDDAIAQFQAFLTPAQAHYNVASIHEQMGRTEQARVEFKKALELDPNLKAAQARLSSLDAN